MLLQWGIKEEPSFFEFFFIFISLIPILFLFGIFIFIVFVVLFVIFEAIFSLESWFIILFPFYFLNNISALLFLYSSNEYVFLIFWKLSDLLKEI